VWLAATQHVLSSFDPVKILKGTFKAGRFARIPGKMMVVFSLRFRQLYHRYGSRISANPACKGEARGFDREGIIHISIRLRILAKADYNSLRMIFCLQAQWIYGQIGFSITGGATLMPSLTWQGKDPAYRPLVA